MMAQSQLLRGIIITLIVVLALVSVMEFGAVGALVPLFLIFGCILIGKPRMLLFLFWAWALTGELIVYVTRNPALENLAIAIDIALLCVLVASCILQRRVLIDVRPVALSAFGLLCITGLSFLANRPPLRGAIHFAIAYFRFLLVFGYMRNVLEPGDGKLIYRILIGSLALQFALNAAWLLRINPLPNYMMNTADYAVGTVQSCNAVAYLCIACICVFLCAVMNPSLKKRSRIIAGTALLVAIIQIWLTFTVHASLLAALCCVIFIFVSGATCRMKALLILATVLAMAMFLHARSMAVSRYAEPGVWKQFNVNYIRLRWRGMLTGVKGQAYHDVLLYSPKDMPYPLIGAGPGNFGSAIGREQRRPLAERYFNFLLLSSSERMHALTGGGSITGIPYSGALAIWTELGPLGYLLYWGVHLYAAWRVWKRLRRRAYMDPFRRVLGEGFCLTMLAWLILNFMSDFCHIRFLHGGLWIWAAVIWDTHEDRIDEDGSRAGGDDGPERAAVPARH